MGRSHQRNQRNRDYQGNRDYQSRGKGRSRVRSDDFSTPDMREPDYMRAVVKKAILSPLVAKTDNQRLFIESYRKNKVTYAKGPAGVGKTYLCGRLAADSLREGEVEQIILTRPAVEAGEEFGFLPGELDAKFQPYIEPFIDVLEEVFGGSHVPAMIKSNRIRAIPLGFMRGRTFKNAVVILDEAQNATPKQMKMFLTRIGEGCKMIINGDSTQKDIPGISGLDDGIRVTGHLYEIGCVSFTDADSVRSDLVGRVLKAYSNDAKAAEQVSEWRGAGHRT